MRLVLLLGGIIVVVERHLGVGIIRLFLQGIGKILECLLLPVVLHQPVAEHRLIHHVQGMLLRERLQFVVSRLRVVHHLVDAHLGQGKLLALAFLRLQPAHGVEHHAVVFLLLVELRQDAEGIGVAVVLGVECLVGTDGLVVLSHTYIILGKALSIGQVVGIQGDGLVHALQRQGILLQLRIIERLVEIYLSRTRVYLPGMLEEIEGSSQVARRMLSRRLGKEVFKSLAVVG